MGKNTHAQDRARTDQASPPPGRDRQADSEHTLKAGSEGTTQRKSAPEREASARDAGSDDRRSGSESGKP